MFYYVEPEVSGGFGDNAIIDSSVHPPKVTKLHVEFDGWLGDDLLETFPCYIISEGLTKEIEAENLTGFILDEVEVSKSNQFEEMYPKRELPKFFWLNLQGVCEKDDFGFSYDYRLVVSERALKVLKNWKVEEADIELV